MDCLWLFNTPTLKLMLLDVTAVAEQPVNDQECRTTARQWTDAINEELRRRMHGDR